MLTSLFLFLAIYPTINIMNMSRITKKILIGGLLAFILTVTTLCGILYYLFFSPQFFPKRNVFLYIDKDDTADSVYHKIQTIGEPRTFTGFRWLSQIRNFTDHIHTGCYTIHTQDNVYQLFHRLYRGYQTPVNLTIGSVRTLDNLAKSIGNQLMMDSAEVAEKMNDSLFQHQLGYRKETLPCLFIPNTYEVYWNISLEGLFQRFQKEHERFWTPKRKDKAQSIGLTPEEVCTLASIVEEETNNLAEKPMVAGLYINRLHRKMPLQADPTIKFAVQDFGLRRITNKHLQTASPYNTYLNLGLPPGPIRIPSPQGIDAVLNYTKHNYIYMCAKEDFSGTHNFASSYAAHMNNARKYWNELNKRKIFK